jgi:hypothetical protein
MNMQKINEVQQAASSRKGGVAAGLLRKRYLTAPECCTRLSH